MSQLELVAATPLTRQPKPHTDEIADWQAAQTTKLLWERVHDLESRLQAAEANVRQLTDAHNSNDTTLSDLVDKVANVSADAASVAGTVPSSGRPTPTPVGPPPGDPGSQSNPIIAMSSDPAAIANSVRLSRQFYGFGPNPADDQYWINLASTTAQFSNGKWYLGWNAYWHARADPANTGSADPNLGDLPSPAG